MVLVDGNNLLYAAAAAEPERPPGRQVLCAVLDSWSLRRNRAVHVVFDGPSPREAWRRQLAASRLAVDFSGRLTADDVLIRLIQADSAPRRMLVVSTDRQIARAARRRRASPIRSDVFWFGVQADLQRAPTAPLEPPEKWRGLDPADVDRWLAELDLDDLANDPFGMGPVDPN